MAPAVGQRLLVHWRTGEPHLAEIVESRPVKKLHTGAASNESGSIMQQLEYYVHYISFDRRLDEWVPIERIDVQSLGQYNGVTIGDHTGEIRNSHRKKSVDSAESKENMAAALEKEHEEITKVKNIQYIELGQYEIETWYFSPYPGIHLHF